ncbi:lysis protein [Atlantibacter subterranea]|uniref:Lysis protein n=1 Tax=Atlantibacter subterraneus TaxID=255519 RepID=A0A3R9EGM0_9ENTR|nr:lysis protein [Atlantibacter subterranea]RSB60343.1 lysis protein [Atlantibacter subterranea]RSE02485.1 lysis protein [Atlantibacter subterranea]RSE22996.1 lysis protein [Atlantibacter subterranea]
MITLTEVTAVLKKLWVPLLLTAVLGALAWTANHYRDNAIAYKDQRDKATNQLNQANATITDMQTRQRDVAVLDAKYTRELADAQNTISDLRRDVDSGAKRLRVAATCTGVRQTTAASGMDALAEPELTGAARRDYFTLRERIEIVTKQLTGLQEYVRTQCLK